MGVFRTHVEKGFGCSSLINIKAVLLRSQTMEFQGSENVVDNIKLRRARHQTLRHSAAADDPPLTHAVPPISQPNRFCNSAMSSSSPLPPTNPQRRNSSASLKLSPCEG
ncbi:unnamed protein product [Brassica oleracea var. botrytis]